MQKRRMLTAADRAEALISTKFFCGSAGMPVVSYFGDKLGGWPGSALAIVACLIRHGLSDAPALWERR